jgi:hypothetical protein
MPNSTQHVISGSTTCSLVIGLWELISQLDAVQNNQRVNIDWGVILGKAAIGGIFGSISGLLPDIFEPATNPYHRGFFHSKSVVILAAIAIWKINTSKMDPDAKQWISCLLAGFLSHHYMDSQTPFGLPIL